MVAQRDPPLCGGRQVELLKIEIAGDRARVDQWLGGRSSEILSDVDIDWCPPRDRAGLAAAIFSTPAVRCEFDQLRSAIAGLPTYTAGSCSHTDHAPSFKLSSNENPFRPFLA